MSYRISNPAVATATGNSTFYIREEGTGKSWGLSNLGDGLLNMGIGGIPNVLSLKEDGSSTFNLAASAPTFYYATNTNKVGVSAPVGLASSYNISWPTSAPTTGQVVTYNGDGTSSFQDLINTIHNSLVVRKDPQLGEFGTILDALNSIPNSGPNVPSATNPYVVYVNRGFYQEIASLSPPSDVYIVGVSMEGVVVAPASTGYDMFIIGEHSGVAFLTIQGVATPYRALVVRDAGAGAIVHKISINTTARAVACTTTTKNSSARLEYVDVSDATEYGLSLTDDGVHTNFTTIENFITNGATSNGIIASGSKTTLLSLGSANQSTVGGNGTTVQSGATVYSRGAYFSGWTNALYVPNDGSTPTLYAAGSLFSNTNTMNLNVLNVNTIGNIAGTQIYSKTYIPQSAPFFISGEDRNTITVAKKGGNFSSVGSAIAAITDASPSNEYIIYIGPGVYTEPPITLKGSVYVRGILKNATILVASQPNTTFIKGVTTSSISNLTLTTNVSYPTPPVAGGVLLQYSGDPVDSGSFGCLDVIFDSCETLMKFNSTDGLCRVNLNNSIINPTANFVTGIQVRENSHIYIDNCFWAPIAQNSFVTLLDIANTTTATQDTRVVVSGALVTKASPNMTGTACVIQGASQLAVNNLVMTGLGEGLSVPNTLVNAPNIIVTSSLSNCTHNVTISHPGATGSIQLTTDPNTITINPACVIVTNIFGINGDQVISGNIYQGTTLSRITNITPQIQLASCIGATTDVTITAGAGLSINYNAGAGYLMNGVAPDLYLQYITWVSGNLVLPANQLSYVFVNSSGVVTYQSSYPNFQTTILLGAVKTNSTGITYIQAIETDIENLPSGLENTSRNAFGNIVESGIIATPSVTAMQVNVSSGSYWFGSENYAPTSVNNITFVAYYSNGTGGFTEVMGNTAIPVLYDNGSGTPAAIPAGQWVKHAMYIVGDGAQQTYLLVYGTTLFASELDAQNGGLPLSPSTFDTNVCPFTAVIVTNGDVTLPSTRFRDIRPTLAFKATGYVASSDHNSLLNLTVGDAHTQYIRTDGTRVYAGNQSFGGFNITSVGTVNGVTVEAHASRHLPSGADPLTTGVPVTISTSNAAGVANSFARSDHIHSHGAQTDPTLHSTATSLANGFMSSGDKSKLDASTSASTASTLMLRDVSGSTHLKTVILDDTVNNLTIATPSLPSSYTMTLPSSGGTSGQVLTSAGGGVTQWQTPVTGFQDPMTTRGDMMYRNASNVTARLPVGTPGQFLTATTSGDDAWRGMFSPIYTNVYDDFGGGVAPYGDMNWRSAVTGGASAIYGSLNTPIIPTGNWLGIVVLNSGTAANGTANISTGLSDCRAGIGALNIEYAIYTDQLPTVAQAYTVRVGVGDTQTVGSAVPINGIYFSFSLANANFIINSTSAGSNTAVTTTSPVAANTWYRLGMVVSAVGDLVTFLINGVSVGTINTTIPVSSVSLGCFAQIVKSAGSTARNLVIDYVTITQALTSARY